MERRLAVAMSGGVDSSVAAWLLKEAGHRLTGVTLKLFDRGEDGPGDDVEDARGVARRLGIPHYVFDLSQCFREQVMDRFAAAYEAGRTPNPCVDCNRHIKFQALLRRAGELGCGAVATGHYARVEEDRGSGRLLLKKALHLEKDQSYVLYALNQEQLSASLFPLGGMSKEEVRAAAGEQGFVNARKRESQDICFVPDGDYAAFLRRYRGREYPPGPFLDLEGNVLGRHSGIVGYTVGQRRGLGVSSSRGRLYVQRVCPRENAVVLGDSGSLMSRVVLARELNWIAVPRLDGPVRLRAKLRYRQQEQPCTAEQVEEDVLRVVFDQPQRAAAPGQALVLYDGDVVVGGGTIMEGERDA